jgi:MYXO-CTERM domain-containing protein
VSEDDAALEDRVKSFAISLSLVLASSTAAAQASLVSGLGGTAGFGADFLAANDDGSSGAIDLSGAFPAGLVFFGTTHFALYVNNNGNATFAGPVSEYTPTPFPVAARPMIAPWWGDVDTRGFAGVSGENLAYWNVSPGRFVATWYLVGYYNSHVDRANSFQLVLTDTSALGAAGDFDVEFRYNRCEWTTGAFSGGVGGLGGTPAQAGFDAGNGVDYTELPGSRTAAILDLCTSSNVDDTGVWRYQIRSGAVTACGNDVVELGEECDDGNTENGDGCNERCGTERGPGEPCDADIACRSGFCTDGVCCTSRCDGQCEACGAGGSCGAIVGAPIGSRTPCASDGSACGGSCDGTGRASCAYPIGSECDDGLFCTDADRCDGLGACASGSQRDCGDGAECTSDACDEDADECVHSTEEGCVIDGTCFANGSVNPENGCEVCNASASQDSWSLAPEGAVCDDGMFCTEDDTCDASGTCVAGPARVCDDALDCTLDVCDETTDACIVADMFGCVIGGVCIAEWAPSLEDPCLVCDPARSIDSFVFSHAPDCSDAGLEMEPDAGPPPIEWEVRGSGCGCRAMETRSGGATWLFAIGLALALRRRRS